MKKNFSAQRILIGVLVGIVLLIGVVSLVSSGNLASSEEPRSFLALVNPGEGEDPRGLPGTDEEPSPRTPPPTDGGNASSTSSGRATTTLSERQSGTTTGSGGSTNTFNVPNPLKSDNLIDLANAFINALITLSAPIFVIIVVYAGFIYVTSAGNEEKVRTANRALTYAAIGFAIILLSKSAVTIIRDVISDDGSSGSGRIELVERIVKK